MESDTSKFISHIQLINDNIDELCETEADQETRLDNAYGQFEANIHLDATTETQRKSLEDNVSINLALSYTIGLKVNEMNKKKIDKEMKLHPPKQKLNDFLNNGIDDDFLEKGDIMFLYQLKPNINMLSSVDHAEAFYVLLIPQTDEHDEGDRYIAKMRLIKIGKKELPTIEKKCFWTFFEKVGDNIEKIEENLQVETYEAAAGGTYTTKINHTAGNGTYIMALYNECPTVIEYILESPLEIGVVHSVFNITKKGSFSMIVKNPRSTSLPGVGLRQSQKAAFPQEIQRKFGLYQWLPAEPQMLDIPGCEIVWIYSSINEFEKLLRELGSEIEEAEAEIITSELMIDNQSDEK